MSMSGAVTVLNSDFAAINYISVKRAKHMIEKGKAIPVDYQGSIKDRRQPSFVPKKILLCSLVSELYSKKLPWNKENMAYRDKDRCVYCGVKLPLKQIEIEHVHPQSRGGKTEWENVVSSCRPCNQKKADRTPEEAGMSYYRKSYAPYQPGLYEFIVKRCQKPELEEWFKNFTGVCAEVVEEFRYGM